MGEGAASSDHDHIYQYEYNFHMIYNVARIWFLPRSSKSEENII